MSKYATPGNRTIITCIQCLNKLRVPADRGKIAVICPVCRKEFLYNPESILSTLKQIGLLVFARFPRNKTIRLILLAAIVILVAAALYYLLTGLISPDNAGVNPWPKS